MGKYYDKVKRKGKEADKLWKKAVFEKWGRVCTVCGQPAGDAHHFVPRSKSAALRLDVNNGVPLCRKCHMAVTHGDPHIDYKTVKRRGEKWYKYIQEHRRDEITKSLSFYEKKKEELLLEIEG